MKEIVLTGSKARGRVALIDDEDFDVVSEYDTWLLYERQRGPNGRIEAYARASLRRRGRTTTILMHKLITGYPMTDHINHDGLDNRRANLRPATHAQNGHNRLPQVGHSSVYLGVSWHKRGNKWQAQIAQDGRSHYLGLFLTEEDAARARDRVAVEIHGQYAHLNFPEARES